MYNLFSGINFQLSIVVIRDYNNNNNSLEFHVGLLISTELFDIGGGKGLANYTSKMRT